VEMLSSREYQMVEKREKILSALQEKRGILYDPALTDLLISLITRKNLIYVPDEKDIKFYRNGGELEWQIPSNIHFEPILVRKIMDEIVQLKLNEDLLFTFDYSLAEVIRNAIIHGNKYDENKKVTVSFRMEEVSYKKNRLTLVVRDEGEGLNIEEHNRFSEIRRKLFYLIDSMKRYQKQRHLEEDGNFTQMIEGFNEFKTSYYSDFNAFRQKEKGPDLTGGLGLLYVKKAFDNVVFKHVLYHNKITGTEVIMEKYIRKNTV